MTDKNLYIIAGCNGAGKTTASFTILPEIIDCKEFVNADEIAKGLSPFQPEKVAFEAGRIMLNRIAELLNNESKGLSCNPAGQADYLAQNNTELNISFGLCIGHDIIFNQKTKAPVTTLIVKDREHKHNPYKTFEQSCNML